MVESRTRTCAESHVCDRNQPDGDGAHLWNEPHHNSIADGRAAPRFVCDVLARRRSYGVYD